MVEKVPMTSGGYAALENELKQRQSVDRPRIIEHIAEARSHGERGISRRQGRAVAQ